MYSTPEQAAISTPLSEAIYEWTDQDGKSLHQTSNSTTRWKGDQFCQMRKTLLRKQVNY